MSILHISSKIGFESLYRVTINNLTMKAEISAIAIVKKLEFCLPGLFGEENSSFFLLFK
jgi:hypothetical protein